jgi:alkylation response protein AidB-like acyl-CoA dehydrogenase
MSGLCFDWTDEQRMLREMVRDFVERECPKQVARALEEGHEFPYALSDRMADAGLHGIGVDERYGGQGGDILDLVIVCEELARSLAGLTWIWGIPVFSAAKALAAHGSDEQRERYLPEIAAGRLRFAFAMTEPGGGTDVLRAMRTRARRVDGGYLINGYKIWSTLAHVAVRIMVLARTSDGARPHHGLTMFLVDGSATGLEARPIPKLGMRSLGSCEVSFNDVFVADADVLGEVDGGWAQIVASLNSERIMSAATCCGMLEGVLEDAIDYAIKREAFGKPLGAMQAIQHGIADIKMRLETARLHTYRAAWLLRDGRPCNIEANIAKCLASEYAVASADFGIQVLGGYGYSMEFDMQRYWRDARLQRIGPVNNEMVRNLVGESLGLPRSF